MGMAALHSSGLHPYCSAYLSACDTSYHCFITTPKFAFTSMCKSESLSGTSRIKDLAVR